MRSLASSMQLLSKWWSLVCIFDLCKNELPVDLYNLGWLVDLYILNFLCMIFDLVTNLVIHLLNITHCIFYYSAIEKVYLPMVLRSGTTHPTPYSLLRFSHYSDFLITQIFSLLRFSHYSDFLITQIFLLEYLRLIFNCTKVLIL